MRALCLGMSAWCLKTARIWNGSTPCSAVWGGESLRVVVAGSPTPPDAAVAAVHSAAFSRAGREPRRRGVTCDRQWVTP